VNYTEIPLPFEVSGETLAGIAAIPETPRERGVVIVVGGPQYRVGSHRQFLLLSRRLAAEGYPALRFDYRGMGDAEGAMRSFADVSEDIAAALEAFHRQCPRLRRCVLWGLCDAASAILMYLEAVDDPRVDGVVLANPWVRSETGLARTRIKHYYGQRLMQREFWEKLFTGRLKLVDSVRGFLGNARQARQ
jgi:exosortase A-associated hydrolase 1